MTQSGDRDPVESGSVESDSANDQVDALAERDDLDAGGAGVADDAENLDADDLDADDLDEEALRWAGDDETGRDAPRLRGDDVTVDSAAVEPTPRRPGDAARGAAAAAFALPYLAWTIGWLLAVPQMSSGAGQLLGEIVWQFGEFLAILAAPLWFAATLTLTRDARPLARVGGLALGAGLLVPWPFVLQLLAALSFAGSLS